MYCLATGNVAARGGGVLCLGASTTLESCTIIGNVGGGVNAWSGSSPTLVNCIISGNSWGQGDPAYVNGNGVLNLLVDDKLLVLT